MRGAREHNLKNISVAIPRNRLTVITGLSGSGKSSLAFDTIYAEGQRRYVESLSAYARQFLGLMEKPDVDAIEGLSPAISIEQKTTGQNPALHRRHRHRDLRLPAAALGPRRRAALPQRRHARSPGRAPRRSPTPSSAGPRRPGSRCSRRWCAAARASSATCSRTCGSAASSGCGWTARPTTSARCPTLNRRQNHDIAVVVDRLVVRAADRGRLNDSIETALKTADGLVEVVRHDERGGARRGPSSSPSGSPARSAASRSPSSSRGSSRSTRRSAPVPTATASAPAAR